MHTPRSALFVPADRPERHQKALESGADAVIVDLEDAVAAAKKEEGRQILSDTLADRVDGAECLVRINSPLLDEGRADLAALPSMRADAIVVPKADVESVEIAAAAGLPLVAVVETAAGILDATAIARHPAVDVLMLGPVDLGLELGVSESPKGDPLFTARGLLVLAAAAGGIPGPLDGPCVQANDLEALEAEVARARMLGFAGKSCIHPAQVEPVNTAFAPSDEELAWATKVSAVYAEADGSGVVVLDGEMIDLPVALRARNILERA
ncbi:MAG TPA: CoA ester lyase [Solirubrobacterales bacterium]|jgi:citrate lyase subunit beta/citryl-CoA lyase|nr:CoA ester lyase [Solirubrobacterales bacterium]